jgi:hypothetical protein
MSLPGPELTSRDVRYPVAIRGKHKRGNRTTRRLVQAIEQPQKLHVGDVP